MKKSLIGLALASALVLTGCAATEETPAGDNGTVSTGDGSTAAAGSGENAFSLDSLYSLSPSEYMKLAPTEMDETLVAELKAIVDASVAKSDEGLSELTYNQLGGEAYTLYYMTPSQSAPGVSAVMDENGEPFEGLTSLLDNKYPFSLFGLQVAFDSESVVGIEEKEEGTYLVSVEYPLEGQDATFSLLYFIVVEDSLVKTLLSADDFVENAPMLKVLFEYGTNAERDALFDVAVPASELNVGEEVSSDEEFVPGEAPDGFSDEELSSGSAER